MLGVDIATSLVLLLRQSRVEQFCLEQPMDLRIGETLLSKRFHQRLHPISCQANLLGPGLGAPPG